MFYLNANATYFSIANQMPFYYIYINYILREIALQDQYQTWQNNQVIMGKRQKKEAFWGR